MSKKIFITGSTDGFGKIAAFELAKQGNCIYIHGRNAQKVAATVDEIKTKAQNSEVSGFVADLSDLQAVKKMAQQVKEQISGIDVLINNAGVFKAPQALAPNGMDLRFVVNHLAPYLLTNELMPVLEVSTGGRVINLSSAAQGEISYNQMLGKEPVSVGDAYAQSKLAITMWSFYLATQKPNVSVIAVNPGSLLNTRMAKEAYGQYWSPAEKGSDILIELAMGEEHEDLTGKYFDNDRGMYATAHPDVYSKEEIDKLIKISNNIVDEVE